MKDNRELNWNRLRWTDHGWVKSVEERYEAKLDACAKSFKEAARLYRQGCHLNFRSEWVNPKETL